MRRDEFPIIDSYVKKEINAVLDKIRAEIEEVKEKTFCTDDEKQGLDVALTIIDKHKRGNSNDSI